MEKFFKSQGDLKINKSFLPLLCQGQKHLYPPKIKKEKAKFYSVFLTSNR